jgi:DNA-binding IclR family transcriptional regulator
MAEQQGPKYSAPAVAKLLDIIELMSKEPRGYSINEIARRLNHPVNGVYRICKEMEARGYFEADPDNGQMQLGSRFYIVGQVAGQRMELRTKALPILTALRDQVEETVHLCVMRGGWMVLLDQVETRRPIRVHAETGTPLLPHASAFGKCLLAYAEGRQLEGVLARELRKMTEHTITDPDTLLVEVEKVRERGYAFDHEEYLVGCHCVGAPVHSDTKQGVAAIGIMGPSFRFTEEKMKQVVPVVMKAAEDVSLALGYTG